MIRRGATGQITDFSNEDDNDGKAIVCQACSRIIVSESNLENGTNCPYCHNDAYTPLKSSEFFDDTGDDLAKSC
jgi:uncharacterized CHY-type Zn-finger protein